MITNIHGKTMEQMNELAELSKPLVKWLNDNCNPHSEILIDYESARLVSGVCCVPIQEFIKP